MQCLVRCTSEIGKAILALESPRSRLSENTPFRSDFADYVFQQIQHLAPMYDQCSRQMLSSPHWMNRIVQRRACTNVVG